MATGEETAVEALRDEIDQAIEDIRTKRPTEQGCEAHSALARGLIVLLRCQRSSLGQDRRAMVVTGVVSAALAAAGASGVVLAFFR